MTMSVMAFLLRDVALLIASTRVGQFQSGVW
jgi:hypothetical protein